MKTLRHLLANNRAWAIQVLAEDPDFFVTLSHQQSPSYLWIGCSDSRVPANQIVGLVPGEMFVHRNVANVVVPNDLNCLSVLQFAVDVLKVRHVIVCGHYGCAGVRAVLRHQSLGVADQWLRHVEEVQAKHAARLAEVAHRPDRLCELNVIEQALNVCQTTIVQEAWKRRQPLSVTGWIYSVKDGLLRELGFTATAPDQVAEAYQRALLTSAWTEWSNGQRDQDRPSLCKA